MNKKCEKCDYWCIHTETCDYLLRTGERRGCPIDGCTRFKPIHTNKKFLFMPPTSKKFDEPKSRREHSRLNKDDMMPLYEQGMTDTQIARVTGICRKSVWIWRNKNGLPSNSKKG